jgi:TM2 domain-containing membrane protein YozV
MSKSPNYPFNPGVPPVMPPYTYRPPLSLGLAYVLWFFFGLLGIHYFYMGKVGRGILWLLTGGLLGIGWLTDLFTLPAQMRLVNTQRAMGMR